MLALKLKDCICMKCFSTIWMYLNYVCRITIHVYCELHCFLGNCVTFYWVVFVVVRLTDFEWKLALRASLVLWLTLLEMGPEINQLNTDALTCDISRCL